MKYEKRKIFLKKNWILLLLLLFLIISIISIDKSNEIIKLKNDKKHLTNTYHKINNKIKHIKNNLLEIENNDSEFRNTLGLNESIYDRNGGFGGIDNYKDIYLYDKELEKLVKETNLNVDKLGTRTLIQKESFHNLSDFIDTLKYYPVRLPISSIDFQGITSKFGYRNHPILKIIQFHDGIDIDAEHGSPIRSTGKGIVILKKYSNKGYGNQIIIDHNNGFKTVYAHLSQFNVNLNDTINENDIIGYVGNSGSSTGPHLHYEIHKNEESIDPMLMMTFN